MIIERMAAASQGRDSGAVNKRKRMEKTALSALFPHLSTHKARKKAWARMVRKGKHNELETDDREGDEDGSSAPVHGGGQPGVEPV